jgi:hypothetical protein
MFHLLFHNCSDISMYSSIQMLFELLDARFSSV